MSARRAPGRIRVGVSGWRYARWRGDFYPKGLPQRRELEHIGTQFDTVELSGSFYSLQRPESYRRWRASVPPDFVFSVKGSRYVTHMLRLTHVEQALANFFASGILALGTQLGPILWQLPARQAFDATTCTSTTMRADMHRTMRAPWRRSSTEPPADGRRRRSD